MKKKLIKVFAIFYIFIFGCQQQQQQTTETENEMIKKELKEQFAQLNDAINSSNSLTWSEFYSKENFISTFVSTDFYPERSTFIDTITYYYSLRESQHLEPIEVQVTVLTKTLALLTSQEKIEMRLNSGDYLNSRHVFSMMWKKEQDGWKIIHSHESWIVE